MSQLTLNLVRHGKTPGNLRGAFVGRGDQPLATEGREELRELSRRGAYPPVQAVFSSPLRRCIESAETIYPRFSIQVVDGLMERSFGDFEGKTHDEIIAIPGYEDWGMNPNSMRFPGGEEELPFYERCDDALWGIVSQCLRENVTDAAVVAHGGVIMAVMMRNCVPKRGYYDWFCGNGRGYLLSCDVGGRKLTLIRSLGD